MTRLFKFVATGLVVSVALVLMVSKIDELRMPSSLKMSLSIVSNLDTSGKVRVGALPTTAQLIWTVSQLTLRKFLTKNIKNKSVATIYSGDINLTYIEPDDALQLIDEVLISRTYYFETVEKQPVIIDCGSNLGLSIIFFKRLYPGAKITGFEPHPETFALLEKNIKNNQIDDVVLVQKAVGREERISNFSSHHAGQLGGNMYSFSPDALQIRVPVVKLSSYIAQPVDFLKMDIEGGEIEVLEDLDHSGKLKLIKHMVFEYHHGMFNNDSSVLLKVLQILNKNGFEFRLFELFNNYAPIDKISGPAATMIRAYQKV